MKHFTESLDNGLTIVGEQNDKTRAVAIGFFVQTGARDETEKEAGISHFLEHMMFKGTSKRSALDVTLDLGTLGAQANAYTSEENTVYYSSVLSENAKPMIELLCDMLRPALSEEEFETEKKVILEEIALYQDRPQFYLFESAYQDYFCGNSAGNSVLGSTESVSGISSEMMRDYFQRRYSPENICFAISGNFDKEAVVDQILKETKDWPTSDAKRVYSDKKERSHGKLYTRPNLQQSHLLLIAQGVSAQSLERYPLQLLSTIIGDSTGSRLYWELVDSGLADSAGMELDLKDRLGTSLIYASASDSKLDEVQEKILKTIDDILSFSDSELEQARNKIMSRIVLDGESPSSRMMSLGNSWIYRKELNDLDIEFSRYRDLKRDDIERAYQALHIDEWSRYQLRPELNNTPSSVSN